MTHDPNPYNLERVPETTETYVMEYPAPPAAQAPAAEPEPPSPIKIIRRALHGRYRATAILCLLLGIAGGLAGYLLPPTRYRSEGVVNINPVKSRVLYLDPSNRAIPMFNEYCASQATIMRDRRVIDMVMSSEAWQALGKGNTIEEVAEFERNLDVRHMFRTQVVVARYHDAVPEVTKVATEEILKAYMKIVEENNAEGGVKTLALLERERGNWERSIESLNAQIFALSDDTGSVAIESAYGTCVGRRIELENSIQVTELEIASLEAAVRERRGATEDGERVPLTAEEIALNDMTMDSLLRSRELQLAGIERVRKQRSAGPQDDEIIRLTSDLEVTDRRIAARTEAINTTGGPEVDARVDLLAEKIDLLGRYEVILADVEKELRLLSKKRQKILMLAEEIVTAKSRIDAINQRIDEIDVESEAPGRISVISWGYLPATPHNDKRHAYAVAGIAGGFGLGFVIMLLVGLTNRQLRNLMDMDDDTSAGRFLGVLPALPSGDEDLESAGMAEHCVHHVRTLLQLHNPKRGATTAITSATASAGKTTLTLALGLSYGATGSRTLLIDADLVGRGLSASVLALLRHRVDRLIQRCGEGGELAEYSADQESESLLQLLSDSQRRNGRGLSIDELFQHARQLGTAQGGTADEIQRLLNVVVGQQGARERRAGASTGSIRRAIVSGQRVDERSAGLLEALHGAPLRDCVVRTGIPNVHVLTAGGGDARDAGTLSPESVKDLLEACKRDYDTVLIDTGPILGSLEASIVTVAADGVLVTVSRGDERPASNEAMDRLTDSGAKIAGVVFNRADMGEVKRSNFSSQWRSDMVEV